MRRFAIVVLVAACSSSSSSAPAPDAGSPEPSSPDASDPIVDAAVEASTDGGVVADAAPDADASDGWTYFHFPESGYPNGWLVANQGASPNNWNSATIGGLDSNLNLFTNDPTGGGACGAPNDCSASQCVANVCRQRVKQKSPGTTFGYGRYQWRIYVTPRSPADAQASVGAFLYSDDTHELDFECGPGKNAARASGTLKHLGGSTGPALANEMLCYATSQANPFVSTPTAVTYDAWHVYEIGLAQNGSMYDVTWRIDDVVVKTQLLSYGAAAGTFQAFISVENLSFIGETYPTVRNDGFFDWFRHRAN